MNWFLIFALAVLVLVIVALLGLSAVGLAHPPEPANYAPVQFSDQAGTFNKTCAKEVVTCASDADCKQLCREQQQGVDMTCVQLADPTDRTGATPKTKVCAPRDAVMKCGRNLGGVLTWSGWADADRMDWNCLCQFPSYASNDNCSQFNAGICSAYDSASAKSKSFYSWNVSMGSPEMGSCQCPTGTTRQTSAINQMQRCVPNNIVGLYKDTQSSEGYTYIGCYTGLGTGTTVQTVTGYADAVTKATNSAFMALSGTKMVKLTALPATAVLSSDPVCQRVCTDNAYAKCGGMNAQTNAEVWALYKKN